MIYVVIQFSCIIFLAFSAKLNDLNLISLSFIAVSIAIGLHAIIDMQLKNLNIQPSLRQNHKLITKGIYTYIRHPMYTSVLLLCFGLMLNNNTLATQVVMLILVIDLILKSNFEEKLLSKRFKNYDEYRQKTGRFIPFL